MSKVFAIMVAILMVSHATDASEPSSIASLHVYPPNVSLSSANDFQRLLIITIDEAGIARDVTGQAEFVIADSGLARRDGSRIIPIADGTTKLTVSFGGLQQELPIIVTKAAETRPISFRLDVVPVFTSAGCNSGSCHGSARGQDGFRLSLFGFDPEGDWQRLTHQIAGRRMDLAFSDSSLILKKAINEVPHTGGKRFEKDSPRYRTLKRWVEANVPNDPPEVGRVTEIEMYPPEAVLAGADQALGLSVRATYSDGSTRDVTRLAIFRTNNEVAASIEQGILTSHAPGEAFISVSYDTFAVGSSFIVLAGDTPFDYYDPADSESTEANFIDELVTAKLTKLRMTPSPLCTDEEFIRRAYLDVIGLLPSPQERTDFLAAGEPDKRGRLIDSLLSRREFADLWVMQWAELLQIRSNVEISQKAALLYFEWVRNAIAGNVPIDKMVKDILTSTGGTFTTPATNFFQNQPDTKVMAENVAQAFLGIRVQCAQCHNHPFDRWTQNDYYGFAAFFTQVGRKKSEDPREKIIFDSRRGEMEHPVGGRVMPPKFLGGESPVVKGKDRRAVLADWLTSKENPYFARSFANRVWAHFMGVGIVEPVDDFRVSNPASNGALLDALAGRLVEYNYDFNRLVRDICTSRTYQRATQANDTNRDDQRNFSHALVRRLRAETILDIICQACEAPEKYRGLPLGARAVQIADGTTSNYFLTTFGRAKRDTVAACEVVREPSLSQALHLLNGQTANQKISSGNVVGRMLEAGQTSEQVLDELYLRCLGRMPTQAEKEFLQASVAASEDAKQALEDVFWAILNSREFIFNH